MDDELPDYLPGFDMPKFETTEEEVEYIRNSMIADQEPWNKEYKHLYDELNALELRIAEIRTKNNLMNVSRFIPGCEVNASKGGSIFRRSSIECYLEYALNGMIGRTVDNRVVISFDPEIRKLHKRVSQIQQEIYNKMLDLKGLNVDPAWKNSILGKP